MIIQEPQPLRQLPPESLSALAEELRGELMDVIPRYGGHFASSLGVVELTIALHYAFDTPADRLVWDVGHQGYVHKMLTARRTQLPHIRQRQGISGYLKRSESPYDTFGAGHAGTSISAATGMAASMARRGDAHYVVSVIGDASLSAGMACEALNHAGGLDLRRFIVILNDNGQSIAPNVGALSQCDSFEPFFAAFGFTYLGPCGGHSIEELLAALQQAKRINGPVALHVKTVKGKGHAAAERDPTRFHALNPPGQRPANPAPSYSEVFGATLLEMAQADPKIVAITAGMPGGTGLSQFQASLPESCFDVGICEQHAVTFAAGLACEGARPVCAIYSTFLQRGLDQIVHDVCIQHLPVVFALDRSGVVGADGETHQGVFDIAYLRAIPNLALFSPKDENELRHMLYTALHRQGPSAIRFPRGAGIGVACDEPLRCLPVGKSEYVAGGEDALLVALGPLVQVALTVRQRLWRSAGMRVAVVNARFVKPIDREFFLRELPRYPVVCTLEDHALIGGFGSALLELAQACALPLSGKLTRFGVQDHFVPHASPQEQYVMHGYDEDTIVKHLLHVREHPSVPQTAIA